MMLLAVGLALVVCCSGFAVLRWLRLESGLLGLGLSPGVGLAVLAGITTWGAALGWPPLLGGCLLAGMAALGVALIAAERDALRCALPRQRLVWAVLVASLAVPVAVMGVALGGIEAPLSTHDGAFHVERIQALRTGQPWQSWYPPGLHALLASFLQLAPWVDTAQGSAQAALGLVIVTPLAMFGVGLTIWRAPLAAAAGALLTGLTFVFPYGLQAWGGWPLAMSIVLVLGVWVAAGAYLDQPGWRWATVTGLLTGAIVLVHGTELMTVAIGLVVLFGASWRRFPWRRLPADVGLAGAVAALVGASYFPVLLSWAGSGGATSVGLYQAEAVEASVQSYGVLARLGSVLVDAADVNLVARVILLPAGAWWAFRERTGRSVVVLAVVFVGLILVFTLLSAPLVQRVYSVVFPWAQEYRLLYIVVIAMRLLEGAGCCALAGVLTSAWHHWQPWRATHPLLARRLGRAGVVLVLGVATVSAGAVTAVVALAAGQYSSYAPDDAVAMGWLRQHVQPGELVANDGFADAGIWAPYKAGVTLVEPRILPADADAQQRGLVLSNVASLDVVPEAQAAACALNVRYVYRGAKNTAWEERHFPPLADLQRSSGLEQVFSSGGAVVFRIRLPCDA